MKMSKGVALAETDGGHLRELTSFLALLKAGRKRDGEWRTGFRAYVPFFRVLQAPRLPPKPPRAKPAAKPTPLTRAV